MNNDWLIFGDGRGVVSLRGMALYNDAALGWQFMAPWSEPGDFHISDAEALRFLRNAGYRWDGKAIVPVETESAAPDGLTLEPVDLSKPPEGGQYVAYCMDGSYTGAWHIKSGQSWRYGLNASVFRAFGPIPQVSP